MGAGAGGAAMNAAHAWLVCTGDPAGPGGGAGAGPKPPPPQAPGPGLFRDPSWNFPGLTDVPALPPAPASAAGVGEYAYAADEDKLFEVTRSQALPEAVGPQRDLGTEPSVCELPIGPAATVDVSLVLSQMPSSILTCPPGFSLSADLKAGLKVGQGPPTLDIVAYAGLSPIRGKALAPVQTSHPGSLYDSFASQDLGPQSPMQRLRAKSPGHFFDEVDNRDLVMYPMTPMGLPSSGPNAGSHCYPHAAQYSHLSPEAQTPPQSTPTQPSRRTARKGPMQAHFAALLRGPSPHLPAVSSAGRSIRSRASSRRSIGGAAHLGDADNDEGDSMLSYVTPTSRGSVKKGGMRRMRRMICRNCATHKTPQWRCGPEGPKTLCNACGLRLRKGHVLERYANLGSNETLPPLLVGASASESGSPCSSCN